MKYPKINNEFHPFLNKWMEHYGITTRARIINFLAQVTHESLYFTSLEENLNYSAIALLRTWPNRFTKEEADIYQRHPKMIANHVYANRYGNGNEESGDGWLFRGRGGIQVTFRDNYEVISNDWQIDVVSNPDLLLTPDYAVRSACWFWWKKGLNKKVDSGLNIKEITRVINPALAGLSDRIAKYNFYEENI